MRIAYDVRIEPGDILWRKPASESFPAPGTKILIQFDGPTTTAKLLDGKKIVRCATAKCNPSDKYDMGTGAEIALKRLVQTEAPAHMYTFEEADALPDHAKVYVQNHGRGQHGWGEIWKCSCGGKTVTDPRPSTPWHMSRAGDIGRYFVLWDKQPTQEQMEAVKWR